MSTPAFTAHELAEQSQQDTEQSPHGQIGTHPSQPLAAHLEGERAKAVYWTTDEEERASKAAGGTNEGWEKHILRDGSEVTFLPTIEQRAYLAILANFPAERMACKRAKVTVQTLRRWRQDEAFRAVEQDAAADAVDALVADAWSAATEGRLVPIYQMGQLIGYRREYSEKLHVELLKGLRPEVFDRRALKTEQTTNNTVIMASPEAIRDAVRRLSPTVSGQLSAPSTTPSLPEP
jgi:hypothetical protein